MSSPTEPTELTEQDAYTLISNFFELLKLGYVEEATNLMESRSVEEIEHAAEGLRITAGIWKLQAMVKRVTG